MGYSTVLYAVDIDRLRSAVGSKDKNLLRRAKRPLTPHDVEEERIRSSNYFRIKYKDGELFLDGKSTSLDQLKELFEQTGSPGVVVQYIEGEVTLVPMKVADLALAAGIGNFLSVRSKSELNTAKWEEDDEGSLTRRQATHDLISGEFSRTDCAYEYGYALERLCRSLGTRIKDVDFADLRDLKIDSPLCTWRTPVALPPIDDFPYIGYLTADEVREEVARMESMDLSCPESPGVEKDRKLLFRCLNGASKKGLGVVAFYY
jgi:hypothetical protein